MDGLTTLQFVDSISASAAVRLDLNNGDTVRCGEFDPGFPTLRRAFAENTMRDGGVEGSSVRNARQMTMRVSIEAASQDDAATTFQSLARELDRRRNYLKYQIDGMTEPVFFVVFRSDIESVEENPGMPAHRFVTVRMLAEPYARGLRETLGPYTVNNDPAHATNGHFFDVTGVIGDVAADCVISNSGNHQGAGWIGVRQHGTPANMNSFFRLQAEDFTPGTDTANPGGGPDASMSGTGANNFLTTDFSTDASMVDRLSYSVNLSDAAGLAAAGEYRVLVVVRCSGSTSEIAVRGQTATNVLVTGEARTVRQMVARQVVDLGLFSFGSPIERVGKYNDTPIPSLDFDFRLAAERTSGTDTLDWDYIVLVPADEACLVFGGPHEGSTDELIIDGLNDALYLTEGGVDPFAATSSVVSSDFNLSDGGFPRLVPGVTNRFVYVMTASNDEGMTGAIVKADAGTVSIDYWPCYLYIRPPAT